MTTSQGMLELAEVIHKARWPEDRQMDITPFADEDKNGRDYCFRIARAIASRQAAAPRAWRVEGSFKEAECYFDHARAVEAFSDWGKRITPLYAVVALAQAQESGEDKR